VNAQGFPEIDHIELFAPPAQAATRETLCFVPARLTTARLAVPARARKLACLAADGKLAEGATWVQESILGSTLRGSFRWLDRAAGRIVPTITGTAHIVAEATLLLDARDPFCWGITSRA
jgi:proline racemase